MIEPWEVWYEREFLPAQRAAEILVTPEIKERVIQNNEAVLRKWARKPSGTTAVFPLVLPNMPMYLSQDGFPMIAFPEVRVTLKEAEERFGYR